MSNDELKAVIREAGGIVHGDGNIFFTNSAQFLAAALASTASTAEPTLILLSTGEYSDYSVMGAFRPARAFNMGDACEAFKAQWKPAEGAYSSYAGPSDFAAWLAKEGFVEDAATEEIHLGSYGEIELSPEAKALDFSAPPQPTQQETEG